MTLSVVYPGLESFRAIETKVKTDDKKWLTYWMIFGFLTVSEKFLPFVFWVIPYWYWLKPLFFVWLIKFNGAEFLYERVMKEQLIKYKPLILEFIEKTQSATKEAEKKAYE